MTQNSNIRGQGLRSERRTTGLGFVWKTASRSCSSYKRVITRIEPFGLPGRGVQEEGRPPPGAFLQVFRGIVPQAMLESLLGLSLLTSSRMGFLVSCEHMLSARCCQVKELRGLTDGCGRRRGSMDPRTRSVIATSPPPVLEVEGAGVDSFRPLSLLSRGRSQDVKMKSRGSGLL